MNKFGNHCISILIKLVFITFCHTTKIVYLQVRTVRIFCSIQTKSQHSKLYSIHNFTSKPCKHTNLYPFTPQKTSLLNRLIFTWIDRQLIFQQTIPRESFLFAPPCNTVYVRLNDDHSRDNVNIVLYFTVHTYVRFHTVAR